MPRRRGLLAGASGLALVAAILGAATAAALGSGDGLLSAALVLAFGSPILLIAHVFARRRPWRWSIRRQLSVGIGLTVASAIGGAEAVAALTSVSGRDALLLALALGCAATQGVWAARVVAGPVADDIEAARSSLQAIAEGSRAEPFRPGAARELVELSAAGERMSAQLDQRTAERDVADARRDAADAARDRADTARDDADAVRREVLAGLAHDLRTPLTSLRLLAEAIEAEANEDRRRRYARQLSTHVRSLDCLIDDLFELSRIEAGNVDWPLEHVRLHELVEETVDAFESTMAMKGIETQMRVSASLPPAWANPEKLQRVLFNLGAERGSPHAPARARLGGRRGEGRAHRGRGPRHGQGDRGERARARVRAVLPGRGGDARGRRPRSRHLPGDRRGPRRKHLARGVEPRSADPVQPAVRPAVTRWFTRR